MTETTSRSAVAVYSSPSVADAELVRVILADAGIRASTTEVNEPFAGLPVATSEVVVWSEDEARARMLIDEAEVHHQKRLARKAAQSNHDLHPRAPR